MGTGIMATPFTEEVPSVIGACPAAMDSNLSLNTISISISVTGDAAYDDPSIPISQTVSVAGAVDKSWGRVALPSVGKEDFSIDPPGDGNFYCIQYACACCKCRYALVFDDGNVPVPENNNEGALIGPTFEFQTGGPLGVVVPLGVTGSSGFETPPDDPPDTGFGVWLWNHNAPPCKEVDGVAPTGVSPLYLYVGLDEANFPPFDGDVTSNPVFSASVTGSDGVELISNLDAPSPGDFGFYARFVPDGCDLSKTYSLVFTRNRSYSDDDTGATLSYSSTVTVDFNIGS